MLYEMIVDVWLKEYFIKFLLQYISDSGIHPRFL